MAERITAGGQYSLAKILGIWALATAPMGLLSWIVFPCWHPTPGRIPSSRTFSDSIDVVQQLGLTPQPQGGSLAS
jgi:hypothetical protein